jgi:hypothetical protein
MALPTAIATRAAKKPLSNPITGIAGYCARATSGHAAAPPNSVMKSRRLMGLTPTDKITD